MKHPKSNSPLVLLNLPISLDLLTIRGRVRCCSRMLLMRPAPWNAAGWVESKMGIGTVMDEDPIPLNISLVYIYIFYIYIISSIRGPRYEKIQSQIMVYNWFLNARGIGWSNLQNIKLNSQTSDTSTGMHQLSGHTTWCFLGFPSFSYCVSWNRGSEDPKSSMSVHIVNCWRQGCWSVGGPKLLLGNLM